MFLFVFDCSLPPGLLSLPVRISSRNSLSGLWDDACTLLGFVVTLRACLLLSPRNLSSYPRFSFVVCRLFSSDFPDETHKKSAALRRDCSTDCSLLCPALHRFRHRTHRYQIRSDLPHLTELSSVLIVAVVNLVHILIVIHLILSPIRNTLTFYHNALFSTSYFHKLTES